LRIVAIGQYVLMGLGALAGVTLAAYVKGVTIYAAVGAIVGVVVGATLAAAIGGIIVRRRMAPHIDRFADEL